MAYHLYHTGLRFAASSNKQTHLHSSRPSQKTGTDHFHARTPQAKQAGMCRIGVTDTQTGMLPGIPGSAICVQGFDDSLNSAIHTTYRISLRPSSLRLPRHPWFAIVKGFGCFERQQQKSAASLVSHLMVVVQKG